MRSPAADTDDAVDRVESAESWPDGEFAVRQVSGAAATKAYRCPGCDQEIAPATPHVVAWPLGGVPGGVEDRRHWHTACWRSRLRRGPDVQRSRNAPRY